MSPEIMVDEFGPVRSHDPRPDGIGGYKWCPDCKGFTCEQLTPGVLTVCRSCCGSALEGVKGDREPGTVLRNSRTGATLTGGEKAGRKSRRHDGGHLDGFRRAS